MDTVFYVVSGIIALILFILIARNLYILDNKDQRREQASPTQTETPTEPVPKKEETPSLPFGGVSPTSPTTSGVPYIPPTTPGVPTDEFKPGSDLTAEPANLPKNLLERGLSQDDIDRLRGGDDTTLESGLVDNEPAPKPVEFSSYYPKEIKPNDWQPMVAYVFHAESSEVVAADAKTQLGSKLQTYRETSEPARTEIAEGAMITAEPSLDGFTFNPPRVTLGFYEDWQRFDFKLRADKAPLEQASNGRLTFTVEGVIVADLPLSIFVGATVSDSPTETVSRKPYDAIFCSYSRKDMAIVQRVERAYRALGNTYMRDMISIRSGEQWSDALKNLIDEADIFQLFWSNTSCVSDHVKMEWDYALKLEPSRDHFIRPVYWENPLPPVPDALGAIHFAYEPDLGT
jgi:hypothetical protein